MNADPRRLKLVDLLRLLNSTPLGEVIVEHQLKNHRNRAGLRIGDSRRIDLLKYVGWLVLDRHHKKELVAAEIQDGAASLSDDALGAAIVAATPAESAEVVLTTKQQAAVAALVSAPSFADAAKLAGVSESSIYRWLGQPEFQAAYRRARRLLVDAAVGRIQAAVGRAVDEIIKVARSGRRDADRLRAATTILNHAYRGLEEADTLHGTTNTSLSKEFATKDVVQLLSARLQQIDQSELPAAEKARLSTSLADSLLRAYSVEVLDHRLEALQKVLIDRKEETKR